MAGRIAHHSGNPVAAPTRFGEDLPPRTPTRAEHHNVHDSVHSNRLSPGPVPLRRPVRGRYRVGRLPRGYRLSGYGERP